MCWFDSVHRIVRVLKIAKSISHQLGGIYFHLLFTSNKLYRYMHTLPTSWR